MIQWIFLLIILLIILVYKKVEMFTIGGVEIECDELKGEFYDIESNTCVNRLYIESDHLEYLNMIPNQIDKKIKYSKPDNSITMDERDIYANMCPRDYNIKQIKLREKIGRSNQILGYTSHITFNAMRRIADPKIPFPVDPDFFKN